VIRIKSKSTESESAAADWGQWDLVFHGPILDQRGEKSLAITSKGQPETHLIESEKPGGKRGFWLDGAELSRPVQQIANLILASEVKRICLEATTLGFLELVQLLTVIFRKEWTGDLDIAYAEPGEYRERSPVKTREFELSTEGVFAGVKDHSLNMTDHESGLIVFFLGYEGARFNKALEQIQAGKWKKTAVFGVPGYRAGWEMNAFEANSQPLTRNDEYGVFSIEYCGAASVSAAFDLLRRLGDEQMREEQPMLIAPIGTKPHGIAAALYCCCYNKFDDNALTYDNPVRSKGRTRDVRKFHLYRIER